MKIKIIMNNENKGAYIPFRELLLASSAQNYELLVDARVDDEAMIPYLERKIDSAEKSLNHYDELLKTHKMQEVK